MNIATWNCNSIRARLDYALEWLQRDRPDIVCLQETKSVDEAFPHEAFEGIGYRAVHHGQKTYNGVAILCRDELECEDVRRGLGDPELDHQSRVIAARIDGIQVIDLYCPNGKSISHPDFQMKLAFFRRLRGYLEEHCDPNQPVAVCGDFNIAPDDRDVHDPVAWGDALHCSPQERAALAEVMDWGLVDALRQHHEEGGLFSWWDYRGAAFRFDHGLRIDLVLLSAPLAARCSDARILRDERKVKTIAGEKHKPSDHAPVVAQID